MRAILVVLTVLLVGFVAINRQRLYLRDPLGVVYRNEVKQDGAQVFLNYSNDILVQSGPVTGLKEFLVQGWNGTPGVPVELKCLQQLVCLAQADHVPMDPLPGATRAAMTNREISFADGTKTMVRVTLR